MAELTKSKQIMPDKVLQGITALAYSQNMTVEELLLKGHELIYTEPDTITIKKACWVCEHLHHSAMNVDEHDEEFWECDKRGMDISFDVMYCNGKDFQLKKELS